MTVTACFRRSLSGRRPLIALVAAIGLLAARPGSGAELVSANQSGDSGDAPAGTPSSTKGAITAPSSGADTLVAFQSGASNFLSGDVDKNGTMSDIYLMSDVAGHVTKLISVGTNGFAGCNGTPNCADGGSYRPVVPVYHNASLDNEFVVFESDAQNLTPSFLPKLTNAQRQIYSRKFNANSTKLVTRSSTNSVKGAVGTARNVAMSRFGEVVAFTFEGQITALAGLAGLTDGNSPGSDIVMWDPETDALTAISVRDSAPNTTGNGSSENARVSSDGSCVVFESTSNNLDGSFALTVNQVYARFLDTNDTILISKKPAGGGGNGNSTNATPNADCSAIVFETTATDIFPAGVNDANGASPDVVLWLRGGGPVAPKLVPLSVTPAGTSTGNSRSTKPVITVSANLDSTRVAFESDANNLVAGDNNYTDVFVWTLNPLDPALSTLEWITKKHTGSGSASGMAPSLEPFGFGVAFMSDSDDLIPNFDAGDKMQIWVKTFEPESKPLLISSAQSGSGGGNGYSSAPNYSEHGVLFESDATNLTAAGVDGNDATDLFVAMPGYFQIYALANVVGEEDGDFDVEIDRTGNIDDTMVIELVAAPPNMGAMATEDVDYAFPGPITFGPGEAQKVVSVSVLQDYLVEGSEHFRITGRVTSGFASIGPIQNFIEIVDDDEDADGDGVNDDSDNCPTDPNSDQLDSDADGQGNACDGVEGVCNNALDDDSDGAVDCDDPDCSADITCGEMGEEDAEGDGVPNLSDNCPEIANADQADTDGDGLGNECDSHEDNCSNFLDDDEDDDVDCDDPDCALDIVCAAPASDDDGDGVENGVDNCPLAENPLQEDTDSDSVGDVCDLDEGICNDGADNDADGKVDCDDENCVNDAVCQAPEADTDGDAVANEADNCPFVANADQMDSDADGVGNACDNKEDACSNGVDDDDDQAVDCEDENCIATPVCAEPEGDVDEDGAPNGTDNCPNVANPDQADTDDDGIGDLCDKAPEGTNEGGMGGGGGAAEGGGGAGEGGGDSSDDSGQDTGCSCETAGTSTSSGVMSWLGLLGVAALLARRRPASRS